MSCTVSPIFDGDKSAGRRRPHGAQMEDAGRGIASLFAYNVQPGIGIDYATGDNWAEGSGTCKAP